MKTNRQLREEIAHNRKLLRERKRQALGLPSNKKRTFTKDGHEYLYGILAHTQRRIEIFTAAGGEVIWWDKTDPSAIEETRAANCQLCAETHLVGWLEGEWHHACKLRKKCDSVKCGLFGCAIGHRAITGRDIQWSRRANEFGARQKEAV